MNNKVFKHLTDLNNNFRSLKTVNGKILRLYVKLHSRYCDILEQLGDENDIEIIFFYPHPTKKDVYLNSLYF